MGGNGNWSLLETTLLKADALFGVLMLNQSPDLKTKVGKVSYFMSCNSCRHTARHVQTGDATLGKVHVCYIY